MSTNLFTHGPTVRRSKERSRLRPAEGSLWQQAVLIAGFALALRLIVMALTADTYDYDEFVVLLLARDFAHGAAPYHDFMFFHPPGILVMLRALEPLTSLWWPLARLVMVLLDTATALLVWRIGAMQWGRRAGLAAGLLYALNPLALIAAVRVGQDPVVSLLGMLGLYLVLSRPGWTGAVLAGICLGAAISVKYPAIYFLPVYALAAWRRMPAVLLAGAAALAVLLLPFHAAWVQLYDQTIAFQRTRWLMATDLRVQTTALFWLAANILAVPAVIRRPRPLWLTAGFALGVLFVLTPQVYYHYFVVVIPFGALAGGRLLADLPRLSLPVVAACGLALAVAWGVLIQRGGSSPLYVTAAHLSAIAPTVHLLDRRTTTAEAVLADRFEYAYLARRRALAHYFWNVGVLVGPRYLERRLPARAAVVLSYGASSGYPPGFVRYLDARYPRINTGATTIWLLAG
jgi:hypothetical protein